MKTSFILSYKSIGALALMLFFSCSSEHNNSQGPNQLLPSQTTYNGTIQYSKNGERAVYIEAGVMEHYVVDTNLMKIQDGLEAWFYDSLGNQTSYLQGDSALFFEQVGELRTFGDVKLGNDGGDTLYTDLLIWYKDSQLVYAPGKVKIMNPDGVVYGLGLKAKEDFSTYSLEKVSGEFSVKE